MKPSNRISWQTLTEEPFRLFFPMALLVGVAGVALWPLYFSGILVFYPGQTHARLMAYGFFGGFILGFLGTALPRMLSARPLGSSEVALLVALHSAMSLALLAGKTTFGDGLFIALILCLGVMLSVRIRGRGDVPPPGFVLIGLALGCAGVGACLSIRQSYSEGAAFAGGLQHLLVYQGFILLPILGVGAFLLPRFFGTENLHNFPESVQPPPGWMREAVLAAVAGLLIVGSFWLEVSGWYRTGPALRLMIAAVYLFRAVPIYRRAPAQNALVSPLRLALILMLTGFLATVLMPTFRVALLHLTLVGGFAVITLTVATRIVYGHSGNLAMLTQPNRWLRLVVVLILLAMVTRISGDFLPRVLASHYSYGSIIWILAVLVWAGYVLPKVRWPDTDG